MQKRVVKETTLRPPPTKVPKPAMNAKAVREEPEIIPMPPPMRDMVDPRELDAAGQSLYQVALNVSSLPAGDKRLHMRQALHNSPAYSHYLAAQIKKGMDSFSYAAPIGAVVAYGAALAHTKMPVQLPARQPEQRPDGPVMQESEPEPEVKSGGERVEAASTTFD